MDIPRQSRSGWSRRLTSKRSSCGPTVSAYECRKHLLWYFRGTDGEKVLRKRLADIACREDIEAVVAAACDACREEENCAIVP